MKITKIRIDGQQFYLRENADPEQLKARILEAARGVAQFIDFEAVGHGVISVLMTPQTPVHFEVEDRTTQQVDDWATEPPISDVAAEAYEETPSFNPKAGGQAG